MASSLVPIADTSHRPPAPVNQQKFSLRSFLGGLYDLSFRNRHIHGLLKHYLWSYLLWNRVLGRRRDERLTVRINGKRFSFPNTGSAFGTLRSTFIDETFQGIAGEGAILDLGGFIGETAVYFLFKGASSVHTYEPLPVAYRYMKENVRPYKANAFPYAVGARASREVLFVEQGHDFDLGASSEGIDPSKRQSIGIRVVPIADVLKKERFNAVKMNIEGAEFPILEYLMKNPSSWTFERGHINFHFCGKNDTSWRIYQRFRTFLQRRKYTYSLLGIDGSPLTAQHVEQSYRSLPTGVYLLFNIQFFSQR